MNLDVYYPPLPLDILEVLTRGLVERVCDGRLEEGRAAEIAVRRAWILLERFAAPDARRRGPRLRADPLPGFVTAVLFPYPLSRSKNKFC